MGVIPRKLIKTNQFPTNSTIFCEIVLEIHLHLQ
jgi:hypothetical protein